MGVDLSALSLANLTVGRTPQAELVRAAGAAGFGKVGLLLASATGQPLEHEVLGSQAAVRELQSALRDTGVRVFDVEALVLSPRMDLDRCRAVLELGAELGATQVTALGAEPATGEDPLGADQRVELFGRLCDEALQFGLTVGVEFMLYRDIRTWVDALQMIEAAGRANAGLVLDVLHFFRGGSSPEELSRIPATRIACVQLSDCHGVVRGVDALPAEARTDRLHLGQGAIPLEAILDRLPAEVQLVIETPVASERSMSSVERARSAATHASQFFAARARPHS